MYDLVETTEQKNLLGKPFLRWAGGKTWFLKEIERFLPHGFNNYYEPFLGGAAVFFHLKQLDLLQGNAVLSDLNQELIDCFIQIRDNVEGVIDYLRTYRNEKDFYYTIRDSTMGSEEEKAARFIYLNRTSFNGLYRVNEEGLYNVPYGYRKTSELFDYDNLRICSRILKNTEIIACDFLDSLTYIRDGDLVFLDPPYTVAHDNNGFIKYNQKIFAWENQIQLSLFIEEVNRRGAFYILTNAKHHSVMDLFGEVTQPVTVRRASTIGGKKAKRGIIEEYVFTNTL